MTKTDQNDMQIHRLLFSIKTNCICQISNEANIFKKKTIEKCRKKYFKKCRQNPFKMIALNDLRSMPN